MLDNLDSLPRKSDLFDWADFIELRALSHPDKCFSRGDLAGVYNRSSERTVNDDVADKAKAAVKWRETINFVANRVAIYGDRYPFQVSDDKDTISLISPLQDSHRLYMALLVGASMRYIPKTRRQEVARLFEECSLVVFEQLMPAGSQVHPSWANGGADARYQGTLFNKYSKIASDIRCTPNFKARDFKVGDSGDGGLDIVAWHPMTDEREGIPIAFAQCGCSRDEWRAKQLEASPAKLGRQLPAMHPWATYYFLPQDLRWADGEWAYQADIGAAIIVDRLRIVRFAQEYDLEKNMPEAAFLNEVLSLRVQ